MIDPAAGDPEIGRVELEVRPVCQHALGPRQALAPDDIGRCGHLRVKVAGPQHVAEHQIRARREIDNLQLPGRNIVAVDPESCQKIETSIGRIALAEHAVRLSALQLHFGRHKGNQPLPEAGHLLEIRGSKMLRQTGQTNGRELHDALVNFRHFRKRLSLSNQRSSRSRTLQPPWRLAVCSGESAREGFLGIEAAIEGQIDDFDAGLGQDSPHRTFETATPQVGHDALTLEFGESSGKPRWGEAGSLRYGLDAHRLEKVLLDEGDCGQMRVGDSDRVGSGFSQPGLLRFQPGRSSG